MGQLLLPDNLPNIVVASTTSVTLAATNQGQTTTVTVGGQQYSLSSTLTLATGSTGANGLDAGSLGGGQLWYVYVIINSSSFAAALIASQNAPATGPSITSGYFSAYKLVGAFYSTTVSGVSQVGSVVSGIYTQVSTSWMPLTPTGSWTTNTTYTGTWRRNADTFEAKLMSTCSGAPNATALTFNVPFGLVMDSAKQLFSGTWEYMGRLVVRQNSSTVKYDGAVIWNTSTSVAPFGISQTGGTSGLPISQGGISITQTTPFTFAANDTVEVIFQAPIVGWNATLL